MIKAASMSKPWVRAAESVAEYSTLAVIVARPSRKIRVKRTALCHATISLRHLGIVGLPLDRDVFSLLLGEGGTLALYHIVKCILCGTGPAT